MKKNIDDFRKQIDLIDDQLINLLAKRLLIVRKVGKWKKQRNLPALDRNRWQKVLTDKMKRVKKLNINPELIKKIYEAIHEEALKIEKNL